MAIKLADTLAPMSEFPAAMAEHIGFSDGETLQEKFDNKELGGGDSSITLTQQEYEALSEEQKLDGLYYTYDTKRIYKNGVQYGASDAEDIGYNNAESGIQATTVQGAIDKVNANLGELIKTKIIGLPYSNLGNGVSKPYNLYDYGIEMEGYTPIGIIGFRAESVGIVPVHMTIANDPYGVIIRNISGVTASNNCSVTVLYVKKL